MDYIKQGQTGWASPIVLIPQKEETLRNCVNYRKLNAGKIEDSYPIPCMDTCLDLMGALTIFSTLYVGCRYLQA